MKRITESQSEYSHLDEMSVHELVDSINREDAMVSLAIGKVLTKIEELIEQILERLSKGGRVFYIGAGTSGRLGVLDASEILPTYGISDIFIGIIAGGDYALRNPIEHVEDDREKAWQELQSFNIGAIDTVIGIAASGTTPYVIGAVEKARENGVLTGCITCNPESPLALAAQYPIEVIVGPEFVTGSTRMKSGTAQKMILNMISTTLMIKMGRVKGNKMVNMTLSNNKLIDRGVRMLIEELNISKDDAQKLLLKHGSVKKAIDAVKLKITRDTRIF